MIYRFWLHPWYLLAIVFSVLLWYTDSDYPLVIFWPLCCLFFYDIRILITPLISFGHCAVWSSIIYRFRLHPWYLLTIVLSVLLWYTDSDYPLVSFSHCVVCSSMIYRFCITPLVSFGHLVHRRTENTMAKRYQGCNQNLYIIEEQTTQWPKYTKGVIRICIS